MHYNFMRICIAYLSYTKILFTASDVHALNGIYFIGTRHTYVESQRTKNEEQKKGGGTFFSRHIQTTEPHSHPIFLSHAAAAVCFCFFYITYLFGNNFSQAFFIPVNKYMCVIPALRNRILFIFSHPPCISISLFLFCRISYPWP